MMELEILKAVAWADLLAPWAMGVLIVGSVLLLGIGLYGRWKQ